jgi:hypothetical protein
MGSWVGLMVDSEIIPTGLPGTGSRYQSRLITARMIVASAHANASPTQT